VRRCAECIIRRMQERFMRRRVVQPVLWGLRRECGERLRNAGLHIHELRDVRERMFSRHVLQRFKVSIDMLVGSDALPGNGFMRGFENGSEQLRLVRTRVPDHPERNGGMLERNLRRRMLFRLHELRRVV
jgi:hypothetical protein